MAAKLSSLKGTNIRFISLISFQREALIFMDLKIMKHDQKCMSLMRAGKMCPKILVEIISSLQH